MNTTDPTSETPSTSTASTTPATTPTLGSSTAETLEVGAKVHALLWPLPRPSWLRSRTITGVCTHRQTLIRRAEG